MEDKLANLVSRLQNAHPGKLVSVILYGSAAAGNHHAKFSDLNVMCVLTQVTPAELAASEPVFKWWRELGNPSPLLMSEMEVQSSTDCFPIEFHDMQERRRVLYGKDVIEGLVIDRSFYRAQVEFELRSKLLRLRQKAAAVLTDKPALLRLMIESASTFCVLGRHALVASGIDAKTERRAVVRQLSETLKMDVIPFDVLLDIREDRAGREIGDPGELFAKYLECIRRMIEFVDKL